MLILVRLKLLEVISVQPSTSRILDNVWKLWPTFSVSILLHAAIVYVLTFPNVDSALSINSIRRQTPPGSGDKNML
jgi:hypothetical protein